MKLTLKLSITIIALFYLTPIYSQASFGTYIEATNLYNQHKYEEALTLFTENINKGHKDFDAFYRRSYCNFYLEKYQAAINDIECAYDYAPKDHNYYYMKAQSYDKLKKIDLAEYYLDLAVKSQPQNIKYYKYRSALNMELGNYKKAEYDLNLIINSNPKDYSSYFNRGLAKFNQKRKTEACLDWQYAQEHSKGSKRFFFYKCADLDLRNKKIAPTKEKTIIPPQFKSAEDTVCSSYLNDKIGYTIDNYINHSEGNALVKFTLTKQKQITDIELLFSTDSIINQKVKEAISSSEQYFITCAKKDNQPVDYTYYIPIVFQLNEVKTSTPQLIDSLQLYYNTNNINKAYQVSNKILARNPFLLEVAEIHKTTVSQLKQKDNFINLNNLCSTENNAELAKHIVAKQNFKSIYFNSSWQLTNKENAEFYRICQWSTPQTYNDTNYNGPMNYTFLDMQGSFYDYTTSGKLKTKGSYNNNNKQGHFEFFYNNGNPSLKLDFNKNEVTDTVKFYSEDGFNYQTIVCKDGYFTVTKYYDQDGNNLLKDGSGSWEYTKKGVADQKTLKVEGNLFNNLRDGKWRCYYGDEIYIEEKYEYGLFISGKYYQYGKSKSAPIKLESSSILSWIFIPSFIITSETPVITNEYRNVNDDLISQY